MTVVLRGAAQSAATQSRFRPLKCGQRPADGLTAEQVSADQRVRMFGAMIELVAERGYTGASTRRLADLAHMSKQDMYRHFSGKESYFLATYDMIVARASERVGAAYGADGDWQQRLRAAFQALAAEVIEEPKAARLALAEVLGAGPDGLARMEKTRGLFAAMVGASFAQAPGDVPAPAIIVEGIVRGVERIVRQRLLSERERELPALADELMAWALSLRSPALAELSEPPPASISRAGVLRGETRNEHVLLLRAAARIAAVGGWERLTPACIADRADLPVELAEEHCGDPRQCCLDAMNLLSAEALVCVARAVRGAHESPAGVHRAIVALMQRMARDRLLCRLAFVEAFALGPPAFERREAVLATFTQTLVGLLPRDQRPSTLFADASAGAVWGILHHHVTNDRVQHLPGLAPYIAYLALAPAIGAQRAVQTILAEQGAAAARDLAATLA